MVCSTIAGPVSCECVTNCVVVNVDEAAGDVEPTGQEASMYLTRILMFPFILQRSLSNCQRQSCCIAPWVLSMGLEIDSRIPRRP
jgi:hypothetical protein